MNSSTIESIHDKQEHMTPSEMMKHNTTEPLTEEQQEMLNNYEKELPDTIPSLPKIKEDDLTNLKNMLNNIMSSNDAAEKKIDFEYIENNKEFFKRYLDYNINNTVTALNLKKFVNSITNFNYDPFEGIRSNMLFSIQDRLMYMHELGKIFNDDFLGDIDIQFKMHDIDLKLAKFIEKHKIPFNDFEHHMIKSMCGKLILSIYSDVERAFVQETHCLSSDYVKNIKAIIETMKHVCFSDKYVMKSWSVFYDKLIDKRTVYKFKDYTDITNKLKDCYDNKFLIEIFLADCIKTLIPSIGLSYIHAVKDIYLLARLITIYLNAFMSKRITSLTDEDAKKRKLIDFTVISRAVSVDYESTYFATAMIPRSMPAVNDTMSEEFKLYYISHVLTGPQYFLLKQLEYTIPVLGMEAE